MNKILIILSFVLLTSCGPSAEEKRQVEMEQQRIEKEASEKLAQEKANRIAAVTCSIIGETRNMDAAIRVEKMNEARDKIGGEPFLRGDYAIKEALEWGLCQELVLGTYDGDAKRERERISAEKQRIADSKLTVKEEFHSNGKLKSRINYQSKTDGGRKDGLYESYYDNGQLQYKGNFKDGGEEGLWEWYHENAQLWVKGNYKDGKEDGLHEEYYENGQLWMKGNVKDGERDGLHEEYYENGQLDYKSCYDNGKEVDMSRCEK